MDRVFGLSLEKLAVPAGKETEKPSDEAIAVAEERLSARKAKNWAESDRLRDVLKGMGYAVKDKPDGFELTKLP